MRCAVPAIDSLDGAAVGQRRVVAEFSALHAASKGADQRTSRLSSEILRNLARWSVDALRLSAWLRFNPAGTERASKTAVFL
ncbi:MAG TPA: hypothetical protein VGY54_19020 [Polyangiaceae bacterium]|nr:hypothetical protein [Polyangiaceae bacterium]